MSVSRGAEWPIAAGQYMPLPERLLLLGSSQTPRAGLGVPLLLIIISLKRKLQCLFLSEISRSLNVDDSQTCWKIPCGPNWSDA